MNQPSPARSGILLGLGAYLLWGFLPLYFKLLAHVDAFSIVANRVLWSLVFLAAVLSLRTRWAAFRAAIVRPRTVAILALTALLIAANWLVYIWAVINGHVLEGSLGYYLNPLVNVLLGVALLKEKLTRAQVAAVVLAAAGVAVLASRAGEGLWISLSLAVTFGLYGFFRKVAPVESLEGLSIETLLLAPVALGYVLLSGTGVGDEWSTTGLLMLSGAVTAIPLLLFASAARRLPYSTLGFLQYIAPTIQFLMAVLLFGEHLTRAHIICFGAIWAALAIFAWEGARLGRAARADPVPD